MLRLKTTLAATSLASSCSRCLDQVALTACRLVLGVTWPHGVPALAASDACPAAGHAVVPPKVDPLAAGFAGTLWNTPKHRKSAEMRHVEKFGDTGLKWGTSYKLRPNRRLRTDHRTGEAFELGKVVPGVYRRAMEETRAIQERVATAFGNGVKDREVRVAYQDEKRDSFGETKKELLVEMEKPRPAFFSPGLLQKSNRPAKQNKEEEANTTVRPSGLG